MTVDRSARIVVDPDRRVAELDRRVFGSFVEHMGRCVYTGVYEPDHPSADEHGFRSDVLDLVRELGVSVVRYPGGNFVSGYRWEDGVGPRAERPVRRDLAWRSTETNEFGLDEFMAWTRRAGVEPMMAVNLGTRGVQEALDLHEYATHPSGTELSERRIANGTVEPHDVRLWCLGNEMDGPWQTGHKTAREYGRLAAETARALRQADDRLQLVACGSSGSQMPTFGAWEATVLEESYDLVDMVSAHAYYQEVDGDVASFLASGADMDHFIDSVVATADHVGARLGSRKRIGISFDEWNVWYQSRFEEEGPPPGWPKAPRLIEDRYNATDAVVVGGLLVSLLRHSDRVQVACLAQLVNVIAPIMTEPGGPAWRQTIFHPFAQAATHCAGDVLRLGVTAPTVTTTRFGEVVALDAVATRDDRGTTLLVVNRSPQDGAEVEVDTRALGAQRVEWCTTVHDEDRFAVNTVDDPHRVRPRPLDTTVDGGTVRLSLPAISFTVLRLQDDPGPR
ncbi:alpha-N-arabinofuranosidase [Angustibacter speluncae]